MRLIDADAIDYAIMFDGYIARLGVYKDEIDNMPSAQPETFKEKLNEIASALSEKFAYMNTCLNERDIILGYLGVKRPCKTHCNTDCTNTKCESHPSSAQPKKGMWIYDGDCYICNKCGTAYSWWADSQTSNYCPNCGAEMRGD